jgi:hypothetical protein
MQAPRITRLLAVSAALGLAAATAHAATRAQDSIATDDAFVPVVHTTGANGVKWRTDVAIFNPEQTTTQVTLYFTTADHDGTNVTGFRIDPDLFARETVTLSDVVSTYFHQDDAYGILEVRASAAVLVTSNTYNRLEDAQGHETGTFGQFSPGQPIHAALGFDDSDFGDLYVVGLPNDANHRTNAIVVNPSGASLEAGVQLVDRSGQVYGTKTYVVPPFSMHQINDVFGPGSDFASFAPPANEIYRLNFFVNLGNGAKILSYATVTDKRTGDPYLITGQPMRP